MSSNVSIFSYFFSNYTNSRKVFIKTKNDYHFKYTDMMAHIPTDMDTIQEMGRWYLVYLWTYSSYYLSITFYSKLNIFPYILILLFIVTTGSSGMKKETEKDNLKDDMDFSTNTVIWRLWTIQQILMPGSMPRVLVYLNILIKLYQFWTTLLCRVLTYICAISFIICYSLFMIDIILDDHKMKN